MTQLNQLPNGGNWLNSRNSSSLDSASAADFRIARERSPRIAPRISSSSSRASAAESSISQNRFNHRTSQSSNTNQYPVQSGDSLWTKTQARRLPEGLSSNGIAHKGNFNTVSHQKKNTESRNSLNILNEAVTGTFIATNSTNKKLPQTNSLDVKRARAFGSATEMAWKQEGEVRPNVDRVIGQTTWKNADTLPTMPFPGAASRRPDTFVKLKNSQGIGNVLGATPKLAAEPTTFNAPKISDNSDSLIGNVASVNRELVLDLAIANAKKQLQSFANDEKMLDKMSQAFGDDWHPQKGHTLIQDLAVGRAMPKIEILPATNLNGNGAFGGETIYLSEPFLNKNAANSEAVANVLVEEIGHYVDRELNYIDSPGDEGEIFARLVRDETINRAELGAIKAENDRATILLDGKELTVELSESSYRGMSADAMERQAQADLADKAASYPGYALIYNPSVPEYNEDPNAVKMWQQRMKDLGYDIDVDGYYGGQSVQVARQFQAANELEVDGKVGPITWGASFSLGTPTADSTAATSSPPIMSADAMERQAQADFADKAASYPGYALTYDPSVPEYNEDPNAVKMWQQRMKDLGYDIDVDGYYGGQSVQVARQFQAANELEVDGKVGPITWGASFGNALQSENPRQADAYNGWTEAYKGSTGSALPYPGYSFRYEGQSSVSYDANVAAWQQLMKARGWDIDVDGKYGPQSESIARRFQQAEGLQVDGRVGPQTWAATFRTDNVTSGDSNLLSLTPPSVPSTSNAAQDLLNIANSYVGVREEGHNSGAQVQEFQRAVDGKASEEAWCMSFVQYCIKAAESATNASSSVYRSEHCLTVWNNSPEELRLSGPEPGSIVIWQHGTSTQGHTGIVEQVNSDGTFTTIEGNTGGDPGINREGDGVYRRQRDMNGSGDMRIVGFLKVFVQSGDTLWTNSPIGSADAMERQAQADLADKAASYPGYALIYNPSVPEYNEDPNAVKMWQQRMKDLGYDIDVDGYYGGQSVQVARQFQAANELEVDGKVGPITWGASFSLGTPTADSTAATSSSPIGTADAMERRAQADFAEKADSYPGYALIYDPSFPEYNEDPNAVKMWQQRMKDLGYDIDVDGYYGGQSVQVARQFQAANELEVDGKVGPITWGASFSLGTPTADSTAATSSSPIGTADAMERRAQADLADKADAANTPEGDTPEGRSDAYFRLVRLGDPETGVPAGYELGVAALRYGDPEGPHEAGMLFFDGKRGLIREEGNTRFGEQARLGVLNMNANVLEGLQNSGEVSESTIGIFDLNALGNLTGEATVGNDGFTVGAAASLGDASYTGGTINPESSTDLTGRVGLGYGEGAAVRGHWDDADNDSYREYGFGLDVGPLSLDGTAEDPLGLDTTTRFLIGEFQRRLPSPVSGNYDPNFEVRQEINNLFG